jgi:hypothetical protein
VRYEPPPRIEWGPDGARVLVCRQGALRIQRLDGALVSELAPRRVCLGTAPGQGEPGSMVDAGYLEACWLSDGRIVAIDVFGMPVQFSMHGVPYGEPVPPPNPWRHHYAHVAANGKTYLQIDDWRPAICSTAPDHPRLWALGAHGNPCEVPSQASIWSAALAADGRRLAMGYQGATQSGWVVIELSPPEHPERSGIWRAEVIDRGVIFLDDGPERRPLAFAFDRSGRRLALLLPDRHAPGIGVLRLGTPGPEARELLGGATCVALDERGVRAVYAYPEGAGEARLRVDYLAPATKGPRVVERHDTVWLEPDVGELCALAFEPGGHRIACLGEDGRVAVVPVP